MSASRYTAMRRTIATANVTKVHYPTNVAKNYDALYSTIGCNPTFSLYMYADPPCCKIPPPPLPPVPPVPCSVIYDALFASNDECMQILDGGNALNNFTNIVDGGNSQTNCPIIALCLYYDALYSRSNNFLPSFNGQDSGQNDLYSLDGGYSLENCPLPASCTVYDGRFAISQITYNVDGGGASDDYPFYLNAGTAQVSCSLCCLPCIEYTALTSTDNYLPSFNGQDSSQNNYLSLTGGTSSTECPCFCRC